jgi:hypothetical protein
MKDAGQPEKRSKTIQSEMSLAMSMHNPARLDDDHATVQKEETEVTGISGPRPRCPAAASLPQKHPSAV